MTNTTKPTPILFTRAGQIWKLVIEHEDNSMLATQIEAQPDDLVAAGYVPALLLAERDAKHAEERATSAERIIELETLRVREVAAERQGRLANDADLQSLREQLRARDEERALIDSKFHEFNLELGMLRELEASVRAFATGDGHWQRSLRAHLPPLDALRAATPKDFAGNPVPVTSAGEPVVSAVAPGVENTGQPTADLVPVTRRINGHEFVGDIDNCDRCGEQYGARFVRACPATPQYPTTDAPTREDGDDERREPRRSHDPEAGEVPTRLDGALMRYREAVEWLSSQLPPGEQGDKARSGMIVGIEVLEALRGRVDRVAATAVPRAELVAALRFVARCQPNDAAALLNLVANRLERGPQ